MPRIILIIFLLIFPVLVWGRSEIRGYISTDPGRPGGDFEVVEEDQAGDGSGSGGNSDPADGGAVPLVSPGGGSILFSGNQQNEGNRSGNGASGEDERAEEPVVLGFDRLPENTLVRDESKRIYLVKGGIKKVIWDLAELRAYRGQPILDLPDSELAEYPTRRFYDNELIRAKGTAKIYNVRSGRKYHVKSLEELRQNYTGRKIHDISQEELILY